MLILIYTTEKEKMSNTKRPLVCALILLAFFTAALGVTDPELEQCQHQCRVQQQYDEQQKRECAKRCEKYHSEKQRREGGQRGGGSSSDDDTTLFQGREQEEEEEQVGGGNPYVFEEQHFTTKFQTQHGRVRTLPKFTKRSKLLRGIENYRFTILEAQPQTFIVPHHGDADALCFVARGRGSVSLVRPQRRESFNIQRGDILRIPSGTTTYLINRDNNEKLVVAKLLRPVFTPGRFESFFGAGGEEPESFYRAFSTEILEAALNTKRENLERIFGQQRQGVIIKASEDQIRALSHHEEGGIWPFGGQSKGTINIFQQRPSQSNEYGQLYEVDSSDFGQLQDLDVAVSFANVTKGGMSAPMYNSRVTKISLVVNGEGYFEMACPHLSSQGQAKREGRSPRYQKVSSNLRSGVVLVVPAGHPSVFVASKNQNLEVLCFEIKANRNEKFTLAGKTNVINQLEREAKELAFGVSARVVDQVFRSQENDYFFRGPRGQQQHQGRADA